jgi:hypothetical protein
MAELVEIIGRSRFSIFSRRRLLRRAIERGQSPNWDDVERLDWNKFLSSRQRNEEQGRLEAESDDLSEPGRDASAAESPGEEGSSTKENGSDGEEEGGWDSAVDRDMGY